MLVCYTWPKMLDIFVAQAKQSDFEPELDIMVEGNEYFRLAIVRVIDWQGWEKHSAPLCNSAAAFLQACAVSEGMAWLDPAMHAFIACRCCARLHCSVCFQAMWSSLHNLCLDLQFIVPRCLGSTWYCDVVPFFCSRPLAEDGCLNALLSWLAPHELLIQQPMKAG